MNPLRQGVFTLAALLGAFAAAGCASSSEAQRFDGSAQIAGDPDAIICRREKETGSRLSTRVCKTAREWEQQRLDNQEAMRNATRSGAPDSGAATIGN